MEVNDLGQVSGTPKGKNFFVNPTPGKIEGDSLSNEKKLELMKMDAGTKSEYEYEKEIKDTADYNETLVNVPESYAKIKLNGNSILVRLFKHCEVLKQGKFYIPNKLMYIQQTEGGKYVQKENPLQYMHSGVIYNISDQCSPAFREKFKVGDVIDLRFGINLMQQRTWLNVHEYYEDKFDNHFIINENMIEKGSYV